MCNVSNTNTNPQISSKQIILIFYLIIIGKSICSFINSSFCKYNIKKDYSITEKTSKEKLRSISEFKKRAYFLVYYISLGLKPVLGRSKGCSELTS